MAGWTWIPLVVVGSAFQTARNAMQRTLLDEAGPWGATLVRFLFGLPFAILWFAAIASRDPSGAVGAWAKADALAFWTAACTGAFTQVMATACVLLAIRRSNFAIGNFYGQSVLPITAVIGWAFGDALGPVAAAGILVTTAGLFILSWPQQEEGGARDWGAAIFGMAAGGLFGASGNAFRLAAHAVDETRPLFAAAATLMSVQAVQTVALGLWLAVTDRKALRAVRASWRVSLGAGFCGWAASVCAFTALAMAPAALVRVVGVVDMPFAAIAGRRVFRERLGLRQLAGAALIAVGVAAAALGAQGLGGVDAFPASSRP